MNMNVLKSMACGWQAGCQWGRCCLLTQVVANVNLPYNYVLMESQSLAYIVRC